jgi:hypothetical protein
MITLADLWLPIALSAVFVFIVSSLMHIFIPIHRGDHKKLPGEEQVLEAIRIQGVTPGAYMFPRPESMKQMSSPEMVQKYNEGPVGHLTLLRNGPPMIGKSLVLWFLYSVLLSFFIGYITKLGLGRGEEYMTVFRMTGTIAVLCYAVPYLENSIWKGQKWGVTFKFVFDGIIYGLVTAGTFSWLWPEVL